MEKKQSEIKEYEGKIYLRDKKMWINKRALNDKEKPRKETHTIDWGMMQTKCEK